MNTLYSSPIYIIGGGPAGLSAAFFLGQKYPEHQIIVLEQTDSLGGVCRTDYADGFRFDMGPHYFYTTNRDVLNFFYKIVDEDTFITCYKNALISTMGKYFEYPIRISYDSLKNLGGKVWKIGFTWMIRSLHKSTTNLQDYFIQTYGRELYHIFFEKYTEKVWGCHPRDLPYDFLGSRIEKDGLMDILRNTIRGKKSRKESMDDLSQFFLKHFLYLPYGSGQFWDELLSKLSDNTTIIRNANVRKVITETKTILYSDACGEHESLYRNILCTCPIDETLEYIEASMELKNKARNYLIYRSLIFVNLKIDGLSICNHEEDRVHYIYLHDENIRSGRLTIFSNWSSKMSDDISSSCCLEYYCDLEGELFKTSDESIVKIAILDLINGGYINDEKQVLAFEIRKFPKCYPIVLDKAVRSEIQDYIEKKGVRIIGRMGRHEYISMAKCIEEAMELVQGDLVDA